MEKDLIESPSQSPTPTKRDRIESDFKSSTKTKESKRESEYSNYSSDNNLKIPNNMVNTSNSTLMDLKLNSLAKSIKYLVISTTCILIILISISIGFGIGKKHILTFNFENEYDNSVIDRYPFLTNLVSMIIILTANISNII